MANGTLYIESFSGIAGDMFVGALLDLGVGSMELLESELGRLGLPGWRLTLDRVKVAGLAASRFTVDVEPALQQTRSFAEIEEIVGASSLSGKVRSSSLAIFGRVARAEADAHGETLQTVHFHEVGMVDSIIDVVAACVLMDQLSASHVIGSAVALGSGTIETQHGPMRVPVPAAAILLKGLQVYQGEERCELVTPTGAALLSYFCDSYGPFPFMRLDEIGYGAGTRVTTGPNLLRMFLGEEDLPAEAAEGVQLERQVLLETNIDDSTPEQLGFLMERLLAEGAADAWLTPITMKKGRAAVSLSVLCDQQRSGSMLDLVFRHSGTLGIRTSNLERYCLERRVESVQTPYGEIQLKIGRYRGEDITVSPEYEHCRQAALLYGASIQDVYEAARAAFRAL